MAAEQQATIFGTLIADGHMRGIAGTSLSFRNIASGETASLVTDGDSRSEPELVGDQQKGWFFELKIPAGRYEFYSVVATRIGLGYSDSWSQKKDFSVPFAVEAGGTYYIGEYRSEAYLTKGLLADFIEGGYFRIVDNEARDMALYLKRHPEASAQGIVKLIPQPDPTNPFLRTTRAPFGDKGPYGN